MFLELSFSMGNVIRWDLQYHKRDGHADGIQEIQDKGSQVCSLQLN